MNHIKINTLISLLTSFPMDATIKLKYADPGNFKLSYVEDWNTVLIQPVPDKVQEEQDKQYEEYKNNWFCSGQR